ncbi:hypothetical protein RXV86_07820 [Alisedimentitalea sp. MJ-SS2]|uniref:hypothetical protein n=1 Tax=Aliisedimentitalea sp. MJ-SS2 TaxID=3049795 RepID=UPI0029070DAD|nr:hypothetical protein [Alisedimentitalea sp. MJ-SS2]MDU8927288.1 hypothetical protein [Alisedimentitalea sp. MJ-SS2]
MARVLVSPGIPCVVVDFDPATDVLLIALPEDQGGGLDHTLDLHRDAARDIMAVTLTHQASKSRFLIHLPGVARLDSSAIAVLSLSDAAAIAPFAKLHDSATLTGEGLYPPDTAGSSSPDNSPLQHTLDHHHDWHRGGPPPERFFDMSNARSELAVQLGPSGDGAGLIYAIELNETTAPALAPKGTGDTTGLGSTDRHRSIILAETAPSTPHLSNELLTQWFAARLGSTEFRAIAWIWLGNEGHYTDPDTGKRVMFGAINTSPLLSIKGPLAGSIAINR